MVFVDTSPRGADVQGEEKDWDFGTGAGFYLNADKPPYEKNYKMYDLVVREIPEVLEKEGLGIVSGDGDPQKSWREGYQGN